MCLGVCFGGIKIVRTITINSNILEVKIKARVEEVITIRVERKPFAFSSLHLLKSW